MTAKQLTDSILQLAIQGKLVPQDPNDEPASILLEKIRDEKRRLVEEKVLKKKDLEEKPIDEEPFSIPENWTWVRLENISIYISRGKSPVYSETKKYPVVAQKCNQWSGFSLDKAKFIDPKTVEKYAEERLLQDGDLLWNSTGLGTLGRMAIYNSSVNEYGWAVADSHVTVIRTRPDFAYYKYLYYYFASPEVQRVIEDKSDGSTKQKELAQETVKKYEIPLPPLAEQHRIVERIEEILPFVKEYGEAYEEASKMDAELPDKLKKSILQEAIKGKLGTQNSTDEPACILLDKIREEKKKLFKEGVLKKKDLVETPVKEEEEPYKIPEIWVWVRLSDIVSILMGQSPDGNDVYEADDGDGAYEFHQGKICFKDKYIAPSGKWCKSPTRIATADSLLVCVRAPIGDVNVTQRTIGIGRGLSAIKAFNDINVDFLYYWMKAHKRYLVDQGTGSTFKAITVDVLRNQPIPLPPLAEQHRIVQRIEDLYAEIDNMTINKDINETDIEEKEEE